MAGFFNNNNSNDDGPLGAIQKAGTTYNTLKNINLKPAILQDLAGTTTGDDSIPNNESPPSAAYVPTSAPSTRNYRNSLNIGTIQAANRVARTVNVQAIPQGFGAYLDGILPPDIAKAAGCFSASMQQIKNISSVPIEKFAQVVNSLETIKNLNVNGTSVPTDTTLASQGLALIALGNGPYGTYTMSNFLGCMSGLPYLGIDIDGLTKNLQTSTLLNIYKQLYLAVTWERATASVQYTGPDGFGNYSISGITLTDSGGGYGREGASAPTVTCNWASPTSSIGTDDTDITNFGRVTSINGLTFPATSGSVPTLTIDFPPGGVTSFDNAIVQGYIDAANAEILSIKNNNPATAQQLITNWELTGTLLSTEQRAIFTGMSIRVPNSSPDNLREPTIATFPATQYAFVDTIPRYATFTQPHMYSQTLEAIANYNTAGGQSLVAMLRESRNQARLQEAGIPVDNNIDNKLTKQQESELIANGTLGGSIPATLATEIGSPTPLGYYDPVDDRYYSTNNLGNDQNNTIGIGQVVDTGEAVEPGSFAGSRYRNLIPPQLSVIYASDILLPATYSVPEAIDEVIRCNCDCWDNI